MADLIEDLFRAHALLKGPLCCVLTDRTPTNMIVRTSTDSPGWIEWRMVRQPPAAQDRYDSLEAELGCRFPDSFKSWHSRYYTLDMDIEIARLPSSPSNDPLGPLCQRILGGDRPRELGLVPFGDEGMMDAGDLCFDARAPRDDADWPIVYWDHEWERSPHEIGPTIFSNFAKLLECAIHFLQGDHRFGARRHRIAGFFDIDPDGAGGPGREYWQTWLQPA